MTSWDITVEPAPSPALVAAAVVVHALAAAVPWLADCPAVLAAALSVAAAGGVLLTVRALPGPRSGIRSIAADGSGWRATVAGGRESTCRIHGTTRVYRDLVVLRSTAGSWIIARSAVDGETFRRLKVRLRMERRRAGEGLAAKMS